LEYKILDENKLINVNKPSRYMGREKNAIVKPFDQVEVPMAFAFPDLYDVGMSHLGSKILYEIVNNLDFSSMERVYTPWPDFEALLRQEGATLTTLETQTPLAKFPLLGITLQYELNYTNILTILDLAQIPFYAKERTQDHPIIIGGGPGAFNPEPVADFFDLIVLGDGEIILPKLLQLYRDLQREIGSRPKRREFLLKACLLQGVYVPEFYQPSYDQEGILQAYRRTEAEAPYPVKKQIVADLDEAPYPETMLLPFGEVIHDRAMIELFRGCTAGCRFCQAGCIYRPVRERSLELLTKQAELLIRATGYDEVSLISLSSMDYTEIESLVDTLLNRYGCEGVGLALPSLRVDSFSVDLAHRVQEVRKSGLTLAPEAGSQRLRNIINKRISEEQIIEAVSGAFDAGWSSLKLYFMIGLPGETDEDLQAIVDMAEKIVSIWRQKRRKGQLRISISVATFVPKPHTPFQWFGQISQEEVERRQRYLRSLIKSRQISLSTHDAKTSFLEAVFSRGDRRLAPSIISAYQLGARFDGWTEHFRFDLWQQSFEQLGIDAHDYAHREIEQTAVLPWDHLDSGIRKEWLQKEWNLAMACQETDDCRFGPCSLCGVCMDYGVANDLKGRS
jgi:radical SAM family uncharacterized protein